MNAHHVMLQDLFHLLDANGGDTASQDELVKAGQCFAITEERSSKSKIKNKRRKKSSSFYIFTLFSEGKANL